MKKFIIFIFTLFITFGIYNCVNSYAAQIVPTQKGYWIEHKENNVYYRLHIHYYRFNDWVYTQNNEINDNKFTAGTQVYYHEYRSLEDAISGAETWMNENPLGNFPINDDASDSVAFITSNNWTFYIFNMPYRYVPNNVTDEDLSQPDPPQPDSSWFDDMWNWVTDLLGLTDEFSDELKEWALDNGDGSGGHSGGHSFDIITPSPTPSPTPIPSPTPYNLTINYPDGTTGTITDIPSSTIIINGGNETTNNYGSDFDIFEVDLKMGDGDSVNPRDGLNSVMDSNQTYLQDIDTSPITSSFSLIPNDWFVLIGVLGAIPFIAGFISKLLK